MGRHGAQAFLSRMLRDACIRDFSAITGLRMQLVQAGIIVSAALKAEPVAVVCRQVASAFDAGF